MPDDLLTRYRKILNDVGEDARLIAVSKKQSAEDVRALISCGCRDFGENILQEASAKWSDIKADFPDVRLHFIGGLQRNKAADVWKLCDVVHSVDRAPLVDALIKAKNKHGGDRPCYIQVNIGEEPQKSGVSPSEAPELAAYARNSGLNVAGLMCVPPAGVDSAPYFRRMKKLQESLALPRLSMGMSQDYMTAIRAGATDVRVGSLIFGER